MTAVAAIVLAAGRSRRMGAFKPLLPFGEQTVIESCVENLIAANVLEVVVVVGHRSDEIQAALRYAQVRFAINPLADSEMNASIAYGVQEVSHKAEAILIGLVDQPAVEAGTIKTIIETWKRGALLVQPAFNRRGGHPVLIDMQFRDDLLHLDPQEGLRGFFGAHRHEVVRLPVDSPFVARDIDTWEDYLALHQDVFGHQPRQK